MFCQIDQRAVPYKIHARRSAVRLGDQLGKASGVMVPMSIVHLFQRIDAGQCERFLIHLGIEVVPVLDPAVVE